MGTPRDKDRWTDEASRAANWLASGPRYNNTTLHRADLQSLLFNSGGYLLAQGRQWNIKVESLGAGISRVSLEPMP